VTDDLSNWYVRLNRKRFWKGEYNEDKKAAYQTLYTCLLAVAKLGAPIAPFYMDRLYQDLNGVSGKEQAESVHLADFPAVTEALVDKDLERKMGLAQDISSLVHSLRRKEKIKVRQPLSKILVPVLSEKEKSFIQDVEDIILSEVNIKEIEYLDDTSGVLVKKIKPNFRKLGKEYGPKMKEITGKVNQMDQDDIAKIEKTGQFEVQLSDMTVTLTPEDVEITSEDIPGWLVASEGGLTVALDITITEELRQEGIARELVNRIQNLRKDMGLEVQDKIRINIQQNGDLLNEAVEANRDYICHETQALSLNLVKQLAGGTELELDEVKVIIKIEA
jgi:isoleucyl-tRNA synthetase